jgi:hypothetical protein
LNAHDGRVVHVGHRLRNRLVGSATSHQLSEPPGLLSARHHAIVHGLAAEAGAERGQQCR